MRVMMMVRFLFVCGALVLGFRVALAAAEKKNARSVCIIGAGPSGLQLAAHLKHAKRDFVVFERRRRWGVFLQALPCPWKLFPSTSVLRGSRISNLT